MVCNRCIYAVKEVFKAEKIPLLQLRLGVAETEKPVDKKTLTTIQENLQKLGFEILNDQSQKLLEEIKKEIIKIISNEDLPEGFRLSTFLQEKLHKDYSSLSKLFSQQEHITLEQYFIFQKIEKIKELLFYGELSLSEIAIILGYKNVQHISAQFKQITGLTPTEFKKLKQKPRTALDKI